MNNDSNNLNGSVLGEALNPNPNMVPNEPINNQVNQMNSDMNNQMNNLNNPVNGMPNPSGVVDNTVNTVNTGNTPTDNTYNQANYVNNTPMEPTNNVNNGINQGGQFFNPAPNNVPPINNGMPTPMPSTQSTPNNFSSMPGFESPNTIGTTPPPLFEEDKPLKEPPKEPKKKKGNKLIFIIIILFILGLIGFGTYYVLNYTDLLNTGNNVVVEIKNVDVNLNDETPDINSLVTVSGTDIGNCTLDTSGVDTSLEGVYEYTVTCGKVSKKGNITVVDNRELEISLKDVYKVKGGTAEVNEFINNPNSEYTYEFVNASDVTNNLSTAGSYDIPIKVTRNSKTVNVVGKLYVTDYEIKGYLVCSTNPQNVNGTSASMNVSNRISISLDNTNNNTYGGIAFEVTNLIFSDESEYTNYLAQYTTSGSLTINDTTWDENDKIEFDNTNKTIKVTKKLDNTDLYNKYGESTFSKYSDIKTYYSDTLGYTCIYES